MNAKLKKDYLRVNWIDGMKINKSHFIEQDNSQIQLLQQLIQKNINEVNFGLLPDFTGDSPLDIALSMDGQDTVLVTLNRCRAITYGGYLVHITENEFSALNQVDKVITSQKKITKKGGEFYIVLRVNPYNRIPIGESNKDEEPPRHPYVLSEYTLDILPSAEVNTSEFGYNSVTIGKILVKNGEATLQEDFIPPCVSIQSNDDLKYIYAEITSFFNAIEHYAMHIIQKIHTKKQKNHLAQMTLHMCQNVLLHIGGMLPEFRLRDKYESPIVMLTRLIALSRVIKNSLDVFVGSGKEELLNYLTDWCNLSQGAFEDVLVDMIEVEYQHTDTNRALKSTAEFTKLMQTLFKKLNELDYIGKKSDSKIFVKEEIVAKDEIKKRRSFLID